MGIIWVSYGAHSYLFMFPYKKTTKSARKSHAGLHM